jgi:hypothetical protein
VIIALAEIPIATWMVPSAPGSYGTGHDPLEGVLGTASHPGETGEGYLIRPDTNRDVISFAGICNGKNPDFSRVYFLRHSGLIRDLYSKLFRGRAMDFQDTGAV